LLFDFDFRVAGGSNEYNPDRQLKERISEAIKKTRLIDGAGDLRKTGR